LKQRNYCTHRFPPLQHNQRDSSEEKQKETEPHNGFHGDTLYNQIQNNDVIICV